MKTLENLNLNRRKILLRIDVNSPLNGNKVVETPRFKAHAEAIKKLMEKNAKIVILAHQGSKGKKDCISLKQHSKILNKYTKVKFINDIIGKRAIKEIYNIKNGQVLLLENIRFLKEEFNPSLKNRVVNVLSPLFDYYINDAFSVMHRSQTSIVSFPKIMKNAIGPNAYQELKSADKIKNKIKNCLFILGGNKFDISLLINKNNKILTTGIISLIALQVKGYNLGKIYDYLKKYSEIRNLIKKSINNIKTPTDLALNVNGKRKEISLDELPTKYEIWDIGKQTVNEYKKEIKKAKTIFFKGVCGMEQYKNFSYGTKEILKSIAKSKAYTVIAGGSSAEAVDKYNLRKKFGYVSLSGGALVHYLAGEKLPGLEVLN